jgi:hypothetical protein
LGDLRFRLQAEFRQRPPEPGEVAVDDRPGVGVGDHGGEPLVLAELRQNGGGQ